MESQRLRPSINGCFFRWLGLSQTAVGRLQSVAKCKRVGGITRDRMLLVRLPYLHESGGESYHESASRAESQMVVLIPITSVDIVFLMPSSFPASGPPLSAVLGSIRFGLRLGLGLAALAVNLALTLTLTLTCSR